MLGEPLPLELANTIHAKGGHQDSLCTVEQLASWLRTVRPRLRTPLTEDDLLGVTDEQLALARDLRASVRELAEATGVPSAGTLDRLNRVVRAGPRWQELRWDGGPHTETGSSAPLVTAAISAVAETAVELFSGPQRTDILQCDAPGCVLYFLKTHPRREWCSTSCGNRVRAARHYERARKRPLE